MYRIKENGPMKNWIFSNYMLAKPVLCEIKYHSEELNIIFCDM